ncbi:penicillin-binding protein 2 [Spartinivicinus poritis]|uniref:Peptidoglycan D,D-transpeptidase MrdA n=1 Tax=Spartinivicinus poritis TaxID=2994640 RepID=A0ABT5U668_9GAMM|nr:penicillin-binding protein 2 [Spartinivicinus sp. A2-2]MDE1461861.1 penicillin-binding protein 2 [Spartinivicinus sp. A2-2]
MNDRDTLKDHRREVKIFKNRIVLAAFCLVLLTGLLLSRLFVLQVVQYEELSTKSDENRIHLKPIPPTRGLIYDTHGILLADNKPSFNLSLIKERIKDLDTTVRDLASLINISEEEVQGFYKRLRKRRAPYEPVPLKHGLTEEEIAIISVNEQRFTGVEIEAQLVRFYPQAEPFAHAVGYVGKINERELKRLDPQKYSGMRSIGKIGVERFYEEDLLGQVGYQEVETNARGRVLRVLNQQDPQPGVNLTLYLDSYLQQVSYEALAGKRGAIVAIEPKTGGILAMVSQPSYDPNLFVSGIPYKTYSVLRDHPDRPLYNRASLGEYPPASTIKPMLALAALDLGVREPSFKIFDPGYYKLPNKPRLYRNWKRGGHGWVNLERAVYVSNDTYFYDLALNMGIDDLHDYLTKFGLGKRTAMDVAEQRPGLIPSREWKEGVKGVPWFPGETLISGIGQGYMLSTPLQLATATAVIANRGKWIQPKLLKSASGEIKRELPTAPESIEVSNPAYWDFVNESMRKVVHDPRGTANYRIGKDLQYTMAGKTGTAQVVGIKQNERYDAKKLKKIHHDHGLFIAFAPIENPQIAIAVIVENGGGGSSAAAPVARKVLDAYLLPKLAEQRLAVSKSE